LSKTFKRTIKYGSIKLSRYWKLHHIG